jgi:hypothetical protein
MDVVDIIKNTKSKPDLGEWREGHIPRSAFPLSRARNKNYKFGPEYKWRLITFDSIHHKCRVLLLLNEGKQICRMTLGVEINNGMTVLCQHEFHASEPGWHCHVCFDQIENIPSGVNRSHLKRWPKPETVHARVEFYVSQRNALSAAAEIFRFSAQGDLL